MSRRAGSGCLIPFGLIFVLAGSIPGFIAWSDLSAARATAGWVETQATLVSVELADHGDTAEVRAEYRYTAADAAAVEGGSVRTGSQVGIHSGSDNVGDWQLEVFARLDAAHRAGQPVPCWYDPADPARAVLDRGVRWELVGFLLIFPVVFGLVGGGIAVAGVVGVLRASRPARVDDGRLLVAGAGGSGAIVIFAAFWNLVSWAVAGGFWFASEGRPGPEMLLVAIFPAIGVFLLLGAAVHVLRRLRHGRARLRRERGAWATGQEVQATLVWRTAPQPGDRVLVELAATRSVRSGDSTTTSRLWSWETLAPAAEARPDPDGHAIALRLPLPADVPATDPDGTTWTLTCRLDRPGLDALAIFTLPVTAGDGSGPSAAEITAAADRSAPLAVLALDGITVRDEGRTLVVSVAPARNPGLYLTGLGVCAVLSLVAAGLALLVAWWLAILAAPILLPAWRGALRSALWRAELRIGPDGGSISAGWWRMAARRFAAGEVAGVDRTSSMSSNGTAWYNLRLKLADGGQPEFARGVRERAAIRLAELVEAARG
jgi:hypothetical protein